MDFKFLDCVYFVFVCKGVMEIDRLIVDLLYDWLRFKVMELLKVIIQCYGFYMEICEQDMIVMENGIYQILKCGEI